MNPIASQLDHAALVLAMADFSTLHPDLLRVPAIPRSGFASLPSIPDKINDPTNAIGLLRSRWENFMSNIPRPQHSPHPVPMPRRSGPPDSLLSTLSQLPASCITPLASFAIDRWAHPPSAMLLRDHPLLRRSVVDLGGGLFLAVRLGHVHLSPTVSATLYTHRAFTSSWHADPFQLDSPKGTPSFYLLRSLWARLAAHVSSSMYPCADGSPDALSSAAILFRMFHAVDNSDKSTRMLDIGFDYAGHSSIRKPQRPHPRFEFPLPSVLQQLLLGLPTNQCLSDVREHNLGCILSRHLHTLDTSTCQPLTRTFVASFISLLRSLPPHYRPTLLRIARVYPAFGIPRDIEPPFPNVLSAPSQTAQSLAFISTRDMSMSSNPELFESVKGLLIACPDLRTSYFEPKAVLQPCIRAAILEFNQGVSHSTLRLEHWSLWYNDSGIFKPA